MNRSVMIAVLFSALQAQTLCQRLQNRRTLVIDVRAASAAGAESARICGSYETQNLPRTTLTAANIEATLVALTPHIDNTAWTSSGQSLGVSKNLYRKYRNVTWEGVRGNLRWWNTTGTPILVYGQSAADSAAVVALINAAGFVGGIVDGGTYAALNAACPVATRNCPARTCALLANANYKILDTRVDSPGTSVRGFAASTRLCARTANLNRRNPWTTAQVETAVGANKAATILTLCYRGNWAEDARQELLARGYTNVINIGGYQAISSLRCRTVGSVPQRGVTCDNNVFRCLRTYVPTNANYNATECSGADDFATQSQSSASTTRLAAVVTITMAAFAYLM